ncbi:CDT1-like protein a, chloroplastic [Wolffia australiana]
MMQVWTYFKVTGPIERAHWPNKDVSRLNDGSRQNAGLYLPSCPNCRLRSRLLLRLPCFVFSGAAAMDSFPSGGAMEKEMASSSTPVKAISLPRSVEAKSAVRDDILTPEKPSESRRRIKNRGVAYSIKDVRKVAASLQQPHAASCQRSMRAEKNDFVDSITRGKPKKRIAPNVFPKLEEKYDNLLEFFKSLSSSVRLLRMKGYPSTYSKVSRQVESLTNRRFSHGHLAQLKYIIPEAICLRKILTHDETTSFVRPDLQITLQIEAFDKDEQKGNGYQKLTQIFRSRLVDFINEHPGDEDVPEAELPEPFNQRRVTILSQPLPASSTNQIDHPATLTASAHLPSSFQRRFSRKDQCITASPSLDFFTVNPSSPPKSVPERTPSKAVSTPKAPSMAATPEPLQTPQRHYQPSRRPIKTKLFNTPVKGAQPQEEEDPEDLPNSSLLQFLPKSLLQSIKEKEKRSREEQEEGLPAAKRRRKMLSCLPRLFDTVLLLFQSAECSVMTRQELVHKIVSSQCDILDRREAEEQLDFLLELVPDWISCKKASTGDSLLRVDKAADTGAVRRKLAEAH